MASLNWLKRIGGAVVSAAAHQSLRNLVALPAIHRGAPPCDHEQFQLRQSCVAEMMFDAFHDGGSTPRAHGKGGQASYCLASEARGGFSRFGFHISLSAKHQDTRLKPPGQTDERIDIIGRFGHANVHSRIQLNVVRQSVGQPQVHGANPA